MAMNGRTRFLAKAAVVVLVLSSFTGIGAAQFTESIILDNVQDDVSDAVVLDGHDYVAQVTNNHTLDTFYLNDLDTGNEVFSGGDAEGQMRAVGSLRDGEMVALAGAREPGLVGSTVYVYDVGTSITTELSSADSDGPATDLTVSHDGDMFFVITEADDVEDDVQIMSYSWDGLQWVHNDTVTIEGGQSFHRLSRVAHHPTEEAFAVAGFVSGGSEIFVYDYSLNQLRSVDVGDMSGTHYRTAVSEDYIFVGTTDDEEVRVLDWENFNLEDLITADSGVYTSDMDVYTEEGHEYVIISRDNGDMNVWDAETRELVQTFQGDTNTQRIRTNEPYLSHTWGSETHILLGPTPTIDWHYAGGHADIAGGAQRIPAENPLDDTETIVPRDLLEQYWTDSSIQFEVENVDQECDIAFAMWDSESDSDDISEAFHSQSLSLDSEDCDAARYFSDDLESIMDEAPEDIVDRYTLMADIFNPELTAANEFTEWWVSDFTASLDAPSDNGLVLDGNVSFSGSYEQNVAGDLTLVVHEPGDRSLVWANETVDTRSDGTGLDERSFDTVIELDTGQTYAWTIEFEDREGNVYTTDSSVFEIVDTEETQVSLTAPEDGTTIFAAPEASFASVTHNYTVVTSDEDHEVVLSVNGSVEDAVVQGAETLVQYSVPLVRGLGEHPWSVNVTGISSGNVTQSGQWMYTVEQIPELDVNFTGWSPEDGDRVRPHSLNRVGDVYELELSVDTESSVDAEAEVYFNGTVVDTVGVDRGEDTVVATVTVTEDEFRQDLTWRVVVTDSFDETVESEVQRFRIQTFIDSVFERIAVFLGVSEDVAAVLFSLFLAVLAVVLVHYWLKSDQSAMMIGVLVLGGTAYAEWLPEWFMLLMIGMVAVAVMFFVARLRFPSGGR